MVNFHLPICGNTGSEDRFGSCHDRSAEIGGSWLSRRLCYITSILPVSAHTYWPVGFGGWTDRRLDARANTACPRTTCTGWVAPKRRVSSAGRAGKHSTVGLWFFLADFRYQSGSASGTYPKHLIDDSCSRDLCAVFRIPNVSFVQINFTS